MRSRAGDTARAAGGWLRRGSKLGQLLILLVLTGVLATIAMPQITQLASRRSALDARDAFAYTAARARAAAVARGERVWLVASPEDDLVSVFGVLEEGDTLLERLDYATGQVRIDLLLDEITTVCYVPGGFADATCSSRAALPSIIGFAARSDTVWSRLNVVGQLDR